MRLEYQILAAVALDLALGDPRWLPHPVKGIYRLALALERVTRWLVARATHAQVGTWASHPEAAGVRGGATLKLLLERAAGILTALTVYAAAGLAAWGFIRLAGLAHPIAGDAASIVVIYTTIAARDLARHSMAVFRPLAAGDLPLARQRVAMIVGRDTDRLDEAGIARAAVESVAESTVDGVTAPLFFALIAGPVGAMVYRAINTLDSTFGYRDDRYLYFGWASARMDDIANFIPARLTAPLLAAAALFLRLGRARLRPSRSSSDAAQQELRPPKKAPAHDAGGFLHSLRILLRDGRKHESPNAGLPEAAMAGALGVQLGGVNTYGGEPLEKPTIGDPLVPLAARHIPQANALMFATAGLFLALGLAARAGVLHFAPFAGLMCRQHPAGSFPVCRQRLAGRPMPPRWRRYRGAA